MSGEVVELRPVRADGDWADLIRTAWGESVAGILRTARLLAEAKASIGDRCWTAMVKRDLPFTMRTAQRLLSIAANPALCDATHVSRLPASWGSLYELSRWNPAELQAGLHDEKLIKPDLTRAELPKVRAQVRAKLAGVLGRPAPTPKAKTTVRTVPFVVTFRKEIGAGLLTKLDEMPVAGQEAFISTFKTWIENMLELGGVSEHAFERAIAECKSQSEMSMAAVLQASRVVDDTEPEIVSAATPVKTKPILRRQPQRPAADQIESAIDTLEFHVGHIARLVGGVTEYRDWPKRLRAARTVQTRIIAKMEDGSAEGGA